MWFRKKKEKMMAALLREQADTLKQAMDTVKGLMPFLAEAEELRERVVMQERIDECLRLELKLVKDKLLLRDLRPDIPELMRLYFLDDPRS